MKDYLTHLEKLRAEAAECAAIRDRATDPAKRELFDRLSLHLSSIARLAAERQNPSPWRTH
jgi:hypothetical protein